MRAQGLAVQGEVVDDLAARVQPRVFVARAEASVPALREGDRPRAVVASPAQGERAGPRVPGPPRQVHAAVPAVGLEEIQQHGRARGVRGDAFVVAVVEIRVGLVVLRLDEAHLAPILRHPHVADVRGDRVVRQYRVGPVHPQAQAGEDAHGLRHRAPRIDDEARGVDVSLVAEEGGADVVPAVAVVHGELEARAVDRRRDRIGISSRDEREAHQLDVAAHLLEEADLPHITIERDRHRERGGREDVGAGQSGRIEVGFGEFVGDGQRGVVPAHGPAGRAGCDGVVAVAAGHLRSHLEGEIVEMKRDLRGRRAREAEQDGERDDACGLHA